MQIPRRTIAKIGDQIEIDGYEVKANQKNATARSGAEKKRGMRRCSGGTPFPLAARCFAMYFLLK
jgi:hypothetical protein